MTRRRLSSSRVPEQASGADEQDWRDEHAVGLVDVRYVRGGLWKAICECGEHPQAFAQQGAAWQWITDHTCPVLDADD